MKEFLPAVLGMFYIGSAYADNTLIYFEAQGIGGYSSGEHKAVYHSFDKHDAMQKNSLGVDLLHKFSGHSGDWGAAALQFRLAYDDDDKDLTPQFYNAYLKYKTSTGDIWGGHNRIAYGLSSYWDTHSDLIGDLTMQGVGFDRDWGVGYNYDYEKGNISASLTSGTGMNIRDYGNWLAATRASYGVMNYDNYTFGASVMFGKTLDTMGYEIMDKYPKDTWLLGIDTAYNVNNFEHKAELDGGERNHYAYWAALYRLSIKLDNDEQWKWDIQPTYVYEEKNEDWTFANALNYQLTSDIKLSFMHRYQHQNNDNMYIGQVYFYKPI